MSHGILGAPQTPMNCSKQMRQCTTPLGGSCITLTYIGTGVADRPTSSVLSRIKQIPSRVSIRQRITDPYLWLQSHLLLQKEKMLWDNLAFESTLIKFHSSRHKDHARHNWLEKEKKLPTSGLQIAQFSWTHAPATPTCSLRGPNSLPSHPFWAPNPSALLKSWVPFASSDWGIQLSLLSVASGSTSCGDSPSELPPQSPHLYQQGQELGQKKIYIYVDRFWLSVCLHLENSDSYKHKDCWEQINSRQNIKGEYIHAQP
jgi:hypothetical protein